MFTKAYQGSDIVSVSTIKMIISTIKILYAHTYKHTKSAIELPWNVSNSNSFGLATTGCYTSNWMPPHTWYTAVPWTPRRNIRWIATYNALHSQKKLFDSTLSLNCEQWVRIITPPWLNTRPKGALDARTALLLLPPWTKRGACLWPKTAQNWRQFCPSQMSK